MGPLTSGVGMSQSLYTVIGYPSPTWNVWASVGEYIPSPAGTRCLRLRWYPTVLHFSDDKGRRLWIEGIFRVWIEKKEGVML